MDGNHFAIAIGASTGGVEALLQIAAALPPRFPATVYVTLHVGSLPSILPELMRARGPNPAIHPAEGDQPVPGTIYVAPPDRHLLLEGGRLRLYAGPKENHCRPAIDPMFRSVAVAMRERAVGVVLTGQLDDGTSGLKAIKQCGGTAIVQDPATAVESSMPASALANVDVDLCLRLEEMVPALLRLIAVPESSRRAGAVPESLTHEQSILHGRQPVENLSAIGTPSPLTCPDCGGGLWEMKERKPLRWRCHTGHAFSARSLESAQRDSAEQALWSGVRTLQEREILLRRVAIVARAQGDTTQASTAQAQADRAKAQARDLVRMIEAHGGDA